MKCPRLLLPVLLLLLWSLASVAVDTNEQKQNLPMQSNYLLKSSVISAAGAPGASTQHQTNGSLGQPMANGIGTSGRKMLEGGFWYIYQQMRWLTDVPMPGPLVNQLYQNFPNPFNPATRIDYSVAEEGRVILEVFNVKGARVRVLVHEVKLPGRYHAVWDGKNESGIKVASGVYFYRLIIGDYSTAKKMVMLR